MMPVSGGYIVCGCCLISNTDCLTAAHCVRDLNHFIVRYGIVDWNDPAVQIDAYEKQEHPGYNPSLLHNDIAVVKHARVEHNDWIAAASLPYGQEGNSFEGRIARASGFGLNVDGGSIASRLHYAMLRIIGNDECRGVYGGVIIDSTICCRGADHAQASTCSGDSGGPLTVDDTLHIGVVSFVSGRGCASGDPSGYARTTSFLGWIRQATGIVPGMY